MNGFLWFQATDLAANLWNTKYGIVELPLYKETVVFVKGESIHNLFYLFDFCPAYYAI